MNWILLEHVYECTWKRGNSACCWKSNWQYETATIVKCLTFHHTQCDRMWLIETCLSERKERKGRISEETANTGVAFYLLGRWGVITANFNQFRSIIHGQGPSELISKMPLLSLSDSPVWIIQTAFTQRTPSLIPDQSVRNIMQQGMSIRNGEMGLLVCAQ